MTYLILSVAAVAAILLLSEYGWRRHWFDNEFGRKFVHITVGSFVAFWPFFLSWNQIRLLSVAFLIVVLISTQLKIFRAIHSVQRPTYGEVCFALTVGILTFVTQNKGIYAAAVLQMSLADGLAAMFGTRYGRKTSYHVAGHVKSIVGSLTFFIVSLVILAGYRALSGHDVPPAGLIAGALTAAVLENLSTLGVDNLVVPLFIGLLLTNL